MSKYVIPITEDTLDLITVLNDGVCPKIEEKPTVLICEITNLCRDVTTDIKFEDDLYDENDRAKEYMIHLIG
jgi:hypothetical protein